MKLSQASLNKLKGLHPDLIRIVRRCAADWKDGETGFIVTQGLRTLAEQKLLKAKGASRTLNSRHLTGHAVDLGATVGGAVRWDWPMYLKLATAIKKAAALEGVPCRWGGSWTLLSDLKVPITAAVLHKSFPDGPHFELPRNVYK